MKAMEVGTRLTSRVSPLEHLDNLTRDGQPIDMAVWSIVCSRAVLPNPVLYVRAW
jgi:hypothetical protein